MTASTSPVLPDFPFSPLRHLARSHTVEDNGYDHERDACEERCRVAFGHGEVVDADPDDQSQADAHGKRHGHTRQSDSCREQDIRGIEYDAADRRRSAPSSIRSGEDRPETAALLPQLPIVSPSNNEQEDSDDVIPIEEFIAPAFRRQFLRISQRAPAEHGNDAE